MQMIPTADAQQLADRFPPVRVGNTLIDEAEIARQLQYHPADSREQARHLAATGLVIRRLLLDRAAQKGLDEPNEDSRITRLIEEEVDSPEPTETECQRYFQANRDRFRAPTLVAASHILLAAAPDDEAARLEQGALAAKLIEQLQASPGAFASLAREYSACDSRHQAGQLGQLSPGQTVPEFERPLWKLPEGLAGAPIESRYGFHVVRVDRRVEGEPLPYEAVRGRIRHYLLESTTRRGFRHYIQALAMDAGVEGVDLALPDSPLMQ